MSKLIASVGFLVFTFHFFVSRFIFEKKKGSPTIFFNLFYRRDKTHGFRAARDTLKKVGWYFWSKIHLISGFDLSTG